LLYIILGIIGFLLIRLFDLSSLKRLSLIKPLIWALGTVLVVYATAMAVITSGTVSLPLWVTLSGWLLLLTSATLTFYSLYINIPFSKTYITTKDEENKLISGGLYALVRHPWLPSFTLLLLSIIAISGATLLMIATICWVPVNLILVYIQDKYIFPHLFSEYSHYRETTPMLIPNRKSIGAFIGQFNKKNKQGGNNEQTSRIIQTR
jgi:protein-S-isoprenylcysteine O-methyltransferase Ste14